MKNKNKPTNQLNNVVEATSQLSAPTLDSHNENREKEFYTKEEMEVLVLNEAAIAYEAGCKGAFTPNFNKWWYNRTGSPVKAVHDHTALLQEISATITWMMGANAKPEEIGSRWAQIQGRIDLL